MAEYQLKLSEHDIEDTRTQTMDEIFQFINSMDGRPLAVITLDSEQSMLWDQEGEVDYQDNYGRQIIAQVSDGITETLVIRNIDGLPVALASLHNLEGWQGIGIDKRLRFEIASMLMNDETEFE
ncbi:MAG: hypothetical protein ABW157_09435 [Candidatus Thiodiazotropha sp. LLP2]